MISLLSSLITRLPLLGRPLAPAGAYALLTAFARIISLSLVTFMVARSSGSARPTFSEIAESFASFEILSAAASAIVFVSWIRWQFPASTDGVSELFNSRRIEARFLPGFVMGALLAGAWTFCFLYLGQYEYVGSYWQVEESPAGLLMVLVRILSLVGWVYCEEYLFRRKFLQSVMTRIGHDMAGAVFAVLVTTLAFVIIKIIQFDLGWTFAFNLALLSAILSLRFLISGDFVHGAAYVIGLYVVFNPVLGLPLFGSEFSGLLVLKPHDHANEWTRRLIGGTGGPFSGFGISVLLVIELVRMSLTFKNARRDPDLG